MTGYVPNPGSEYCRRGGGRDRDGNGNNTGPDPAKEVRLFQSSYGQLERLTDDVFCSKAKFISALSQRGYLQPVCDTLRVLDQNVINYELATKLVTHVCADMEPGAILIFMPGLAEISKLHESLSNNPTVRAATLNSQYLIALHSTLSTAEQKVIFEHPPAGIRKIVIATNIAETSITIDDVVSVCINSLCSVLKYPNTTQLLITITPRTHSLQVYVIDAGKCKENGYDPNTRMQLLLERWVSRASAKQRRGKFIFTFVRAIKMTSRVFCSQAAPAESAPADVSVCTPGRCTTTCSTSTPCRRSSACLWKVCVYRFSSSECRAASRVSWAKPWNHPNKIPLNRPSEPCGRLARWTRRKT